MSKCVVVIASGEKERRSLPRLLSHLNDRHVEVRIPPRNRTLNVDEVYRLIQSARFELRPDKYVILVNVGGRFPSDLVEPLRKGVVARFDEQFSSQIKFAYAQWHLEAWYFGDSQSLRDYFQGKALGKVDTSQPDKINNPKLHLTNLLGAEFYSARVSEEIAGNLNARTIAGRSPSFELFLSAVMNGHSIASTGGSESPDP